MAYGPIMRYGNGFKAMSTADLQYVRYVIRKQYFDSGEEAGTLRINSAPDSSWVSIGSATDRVKSSGVSIVTEDIDKQGVSVPYITDATPITYTFYQKRGSYPEPNPEKAIKDKFPLVINGNEWAPGDSTSSSVGYTARLTAISLIDYYYLAAQSSVSGFANTGYSLSDRVVVPGTTNTNTTVYNLFRKTSENPPSTQSRPLMIKYGEPAATFQEMTDQDIIDVYYPYFQWMISEVGLPLFKFGVPAAISGYGFVRGKYIENYYSLSSDQVATGDHTYERDASGLQVTEYLLAGRFP
jgi:hypothetical protein